MWQGVTWRLGGLRGKAKVLKGAIQEHRMAYGTLPAKRSWAEVEADLAGQGFTKNALFLQVINKGRQPIQVERWCVRFPGKIRVAELRSTLGPPLPHRLEVGASKMWGIELETLMPTVEQLCRTKRKRSIPVRLEVELGHDKTLRTRGRRVRLEPGLAGGGARQPRIPPLGLWPPLHGPRMLSAASRSATLELEHSARPARARRRAAGPYGAPD